MAKYILALDQGTTSSRAILFDEEQKIVGMAQKEFTQIYPREGWVEHDPEEIFASQYAVMLELISRCDISAGDIAAIGIANQRETTIVWDRATGKPVYNAIVWQCRRTADIVEGLVKNGLSDYIKKTTGLLPDAYFSGPKIAWILDQVEGGRDRARRGELLFGTVDTWLIWKLTGDNVCNNGASNSGTGSGVHVTDYTNASRTMLFDINKLDWDDVLLKALNIPRAMLPEVRPSSSIYGKVRIQGQDIPIAGCAGDQQAALFGQCCFEKGEAKNTYGTGCFLLTHTGTTPCISGHGLLATIAADTGERPGYALEGSVFVGGAVVQWLRDEMGLISDSADVRNFAGKVEDSGGVYLVPAFTGLGAPHWDMYARGCIVGITRGTSRNHIIRAAEESIAYQSLDLIRAMEKDLGHAITTLKVDGGASRDDLLMQFQADIMNGEIRRPGNPETTALGAAYLAGLAVCVWRGREELKQGWNCGKTFTPAMAPDRRDKLLAGWHKAVGRSRDWASS